MSPLPAGAGAGVGGECGSRGGGDGGTERGSVRGCVAGMLAPLMSRTPDARAAAAPENAAGRDYRTVPVEAIRRFAQDETELTSIRHVAAEVGLGRTTLHKFVAGETMPHPRVRRLLALWYLRRHDQAAEDETVRPYATALGILLACVPDEVRMGAAEDVLNVLERHAVTGGERPPWMDALRTRAAGGAAGPDEVE
jgi:hypothetical protein